MLINSVLRLLKISPNIFLLMTLSTSLKLMPRQASLRAIHGGIWAQRKDRSVRRQRKERVVGDTRLKRELRGKAR